MFSLRSRAVRFRQLWMETRLRFRRFIGGAPRRKPHVFISIVTGGRSGRCPWGQWTLSARHRVVLAIMASSACRVFHNSIPRFADSPRGPCPVFHNSKLFDQLMLASVLQALARKISKILTSSACGRDRPSRGRAWLFSMRGQPARIDAPPPREFGGGLVRA